MLSYQLLCAKCGMMLAGGGRTNWDTHLANPRICHPPKPRLVLYNHNNQTKDWLPETWEIIPCS